MTMTSRGPFLLRQLLSAATLATGFGTLWLLLALWLASAIEEAGRGTQSTLPPREDFVVMSDGTPLVESTSYTNQLHTAYRDLNGQAREVSDRSDLISGIFVTGAAGMPGVLSAKPGWQHRVMRFIDDREPGINWYFVHDGRMDGAGYFVGYQRENNMRIGYIGLSGFRLQSLPADEWVPVRGSLLMSFSYWSSAPISIYAPREWELRPNVSDLPPHLVYVPSGNELRQVDLATRTVRTVFETPEPIESVGVPLLGSFTTGHPSTERPILLRTGQHIYALNHKHEITKLFTIPTAVDQRSTAVWYESADGQAFAEFYRPWSNQAAGGIEQRLVYRIAADGTIRDRFELALQSGMAGWRMRQAAMQLPFDLPVPAILLLVEPLLMTPANQELSYWGALRSLTRRSWLLLMAVVAVSSVLAAAAWRNNRSFGSSKREQLAWAVFILLFGLPGFVGYLLHRRWPIRQRCPQCQVQSPRDRSTCAACGTAFPQPDLKGTEIFA